MNLTKIAVSPIQILYGRLLVTSTNFKKSVVSHLCESHREAYDSLVNLRETLRITHLNLTENRKIHYGCAYLT